MTSKRSRDEGETGFDDFGLKARPRTRRAQSDDNGLGSIPIAARSESEDPLIGADLGGFRIMRLIAEGGMGRVYEGAQEKPRRPVAIKVMRPGCISPEAIRRFENEWELLGKLRHPNIAQIYYASTYNVLGTRVPYFVMEYIPDSLPITKYASSKKLSTAQRLKLFGRVCEAVAHGHKQGIVHRDLKPSNILVEPSGLLKVIDFGIARKVHADPAHATQLTSIGQLIGTLQYMSPEQFSADPSAIDQRTDVYALGVILYELLTGKPPYELRQKHILDAAQVVREYAPVSPAKLNRNVTASMESITGKCLHKDRAQRYATAAELANAIAGCLSVQSTERSQCQSPQSDVSPSAGGGKHYLESLRSGLSGSGRLVPDVASKVSTRLLLLFACAMICVAGAWHLIDAWLIRDDHSSLQAPVTSTSAVTVAETDISSQSQQTQFSVTNTNSKEVAVASVSPKLRDQHDTPLISSPPTMSIATIEQAMVSVDGGVLPSTSAVATKAVNSFFISTHEVTNKEWREVQAYAEKNGYTLDAKAHNTEDRQPVAEVSWYEAIVWCNAKSEMDQLRPAYLDAAGKTVYRRRNSYELPVWDAVASGYRLPTEAEWEWAASGGIKSHGFRFSGSDVLDDVAWHPGNSRGRASSVGQKKPNELGLFDMTGNVREWCWSTLDEGPEPNNRVVRGGGWQYVELPKDFDVREREYARRLDTMQNDLGFRIARNREP